MWKCCEINLLLTYLLTSVCNKILFLFVWPLDNVWRNCVPKSSESCQKFSENHQNWSIFLLPALMKSLS